MSWWSSSTEIEKEIFRATSSSIPSGEQDLVLNLEISDSIRSKQASSVEAIKALRKRLYDRNPNVQILTLHLLDLLVKNGGPQFFTEVTSKEFIDAYVAQLMSLVNQNRNSEVVDLMLDYFQTWALASTSRPEASYLRDKYNELKKRTDITFPEPMIGEISESFLESATAPEWIDSETCMKSGQPFTFYARKHHCRNCGGVFLQQYVLHFRPLPHFGINVPVRVCDDCNAKLDAKYGTPGTVTNRSSRHAEVSGSQKRSIVSNNKDIGSRYKQDLEQAINLSLNATDTRQTAAGGSNQIYDDDDDLDEDTRRAIEASLQEMKQQPTTDFKTSEPNPPGPGSQLKNSNDGANLAEIRGKIEDFNSLVQVSNPREAIYNQRLIDLNEDAVKLQPKVISELRISSDKLARLEDLQGKLLAVCSYYDRLLEAELNPEFERLNGARAQNEEINSARPDQQHISVPIDQGTAEGGTTQIPAPVPLSTDLKSVPEDHKVEPKEELEPEPILIEL